mgnify:CR=1 FL=1
MVWTDSGARTIFKKSRSRIGEVQFLLVGKGVPEMGGENVVVAGFVEDLFSVL